MAVIKEYSCPVHGYFESGFAVCPECGNTNVQRVFTSPPSFKSDGTKLKDNELRQLTMSYGLSDYSNNESTKHFNDHSDTWKPIDQAMGDLSAMGITLRKPTVEERAKPTPLKPSPINESFKGKIGTYEAISHKEDKGRAA